MKKNEQIDFLKKSREESTLVHDGMEKSLIVGEKIYEPTDEDREFAIRAFEAGGKPITLRDPKKIAIENKKEFEKAKEDLKKIFEEPGSQPDLL